MNRKATLDQITGPFKGRDGDYFWEFVGHRNVGHRSWPVTARLFTLYFQPETRTFGVLAKRRLSKRKKRVKVVVSHGMVAYLRSRLPPAEIARCTALAITHRPVVAFKPAAMGKSTAAFQQLQTSMAGLSDAIQKALMVHPRQLGKTHLLKGTRK